MVDILVRNVDDETAQRLKDKAARSGTSISEAARAALTAYVKPTKADSWAEIDRIRRRIGTVAGDSTVDIRADRDR